MAAIITTESDGQFLQPGINVFGGVIAQTEVFQTSGVRIADISGCKTEVFPVNAVEDDDTLDFGENVVACAWQGDDVSADHATVFLTDQSAGTVRFDVASGTIEGYVWILRGGADVNS